MANRNPMDLSGTTWGNAIQNAIVRQAELPAKQAAFDAEQRREAIDLAGPVPLASPRTGRPLPIPKGSRGKR